MYQFKKINKTKLYQLVKEFAGIRNLPPMRQCQFGYYSRTNTCYLSFKERPDSFTVTYDHWGNDVYLMVSEKPDLELTYQERRDEVVHLNLYWLHRHGFIDEVSETPSEITDSAPDTPSQSTDSTAGSSSEATDNAAGSPLETTDNTADLWHDIEKLLTPPRKLRHKPLAAPPVPPQTTDNAAGSPSETTDSTADLWHDIRDLPDKTGNYLVRYADGTMDILRFTTNGCYFWVTNNKMITAWTNRFKVPDTSCALCGKARWRDRNSCMSYTCGTPMCTEAPDGEPPRKEAASRVV